MNHHLTIHPSFQTASSYTILSCKVKVVTASLVSALNLRKSKLFTQVFCVMSMKVGEVKVFP
jgi:hypothetical protein